MIDLAISRGIETIGAADSALEGYRSLPLDQFLDQAAGSVGSWAIFDLERRVAVTSPGFQGVFWDRETRAASLRMDELLQRRRERSLPLLDDAGVIWYLANNANNPTYALPVSTPLAGIQRVAGGLSIDDIDDPAPRSYFLGAHEAADHRTFEAAMLTTAAALPGRPTLLFSGGRDSLAIALALREARGIEHTHLLHVAGDSKGTRPEHAIAAASEFGLSVEILEPQGGWAFGSSSRAPELEQLLARSLVSASSFRHVIPQNDDDPLIDGQNMDAMTAFVLKKPQVGARSSVFHKIVRSVGEQRQYNRSLGAEFGPADLAGQPRGVRLPSTGHYSAPRIDGRGAEVETQLIEALRADETFLRRYLRSSSTPKQAYFYAYCSLAMMYGSGTEAAAVGSSFVNNGPFRPHWNARLSFADFYEPKRYVNRFIGRRGGGNLFANPPKASSRPTMADTSSLRELAHYLVPENSGVIDHLRPQLRDWYLGHVADIHASIMSSEPPTVASQKALLKRALRTLNLEVLLRSE